MGSLSWPVLTMARISSLVKLMTIFAARYVSSSVAFRKAGFGYSGFQFWGSKTLDSNRPIDGWFGFETRTQFLSHSPRVAIRLNVVDGSHMYSQPARAFWALTLPLPSVEPKSIR